MAFDLTAPTAAQANRRSRHSASVGRRCVTTFHPESSTACASRVRSCTRKPPRIRLKSQPPSPPVAAGGSRTTRRFFFSRNTASASVWTSGATTTSTNRSRIASAAARSTATLNAMTEPNADVRSVASARSYASRGERPSAMPHGVVCLMMAHAARSDLLHGATARMAASKSSRLLNDSSLPWSCARSRIPGSSVAYSAAA